MIIRTWEIFQVSEKSVLGVLQRKICRSYLGYCVSNLRGNLVFFEHISKLLISSLTQEKSNCCLFFSPTGNCGPPKKSHTFKLWLSKVLLPTLQTSQMGRRRMRINDEIKGRKQLNQMLIGRLLFQAPDKAWQ